MKRSIGVVAFVVVALGLVIVVWKTNTIESGSSAEPKMTPDKQSIEEPKQLEITEPSQKLVLTEEMIESRGPRPTTSRVREGQQQVETDDQARLALKEALDRIDREIAAETDEAKRKVLEAKKDLIVQAAENRNR